MTPPVNTRAADDPNDETWREREFKGISDEETRVMIARAIQKELARIRDGEMDPGGIKAEVAGQKVQIWGRHTSQLLVALALVAAVGTMVWDAREGRKETQAMVQQQWAQSAERNRQMRYDHDKISYERREDRCILLFDPAERKALRAILNAGGNPFKIECSWLGTPPTPPRGVIDGHPE